MIGRSYLAYRKAQRLLMTPADTSPTPTVTDASPVSGTALGGTTVTLTGTGFMSSAGLSYVESVKFGSANATSFSVVSATSITAVSPAHAAGVVSVIVNTSGGCGVNVSGYTFT
jgi:hypothetical protein